MLKRIRLTIVTLILLITTTFASYAYPYWSGTVPLPTADYSYRLSIRDLASGFSSDPAAAKNTYLTVDLKGGNNIQITWSETRGYGVWVADAAGMPYVSTTKRESASKYTHYYTFTIPHNYHGGTIRINVPYDEWEDHKGEWRFAGNQNFYITVSPAPCAHSSNTWRYDANNLGILPFVKRLTDSYECST